MSDGQRGADEPYLLDVFLKLDGETVRQSTADLDRFEGHVRVVTAPGSHGNLGVEDVEGEQRIPIPVERGVFTTDLQPIRRRIGRRVGPRDLWPPAERQTWYEEQARLGETLVQSRLIAPERLEQTLRVLRTKLRLQ